MADILDTASKERIYGVFLNIVPELNNPKKYYFQTLKIRDYLIFQKTRKYITKDYYFILVVIVAGATAAEITIIIIITVTAQVI